MKIIYKYLLQVADKQVLQLPLGYKILSLQVQNEMPCLWLEMNLDETKKVLVPLYTFGTGRTFSNLPELKYIGTYQLEGGALVLHAYSGEEENAQT